MFLPISSMSFIYFVFEPLSREGAKGYIFFQIGTSLREASPWQADDLKKNHAMTGKMHLREHCGTSSDYKFLLMKFFDLLIFLLAEMKESA